VPGLGDANVGGVVAIGNEAKLDRRGFVVIAPVDEDPAVVFDLLDPDLRPGAVHLPFPSDGRPRTSLPLLLVNQNRIVSKSRARRGLAARMLLVAGSDEVSDDGYRSRRRSRSER
jgi:hypothetical protein